MERLVYGIGHFLFARLANKKSCKQKVANQTIIAKMHINKAFQKYDLNILRFSQLSSDLQLISTFKQAGLLTDITQLVWSICQGGRTSDPWTAVFLIGFTFLPQLKWGIPRICNIYQRHLVAKLWTKQSYICSPLFSFYYFYNIAFARSLILLNKPIDTELKMLQWQSAF